MANAKYNRRFPHETGTPFLKHDCERRVPKSDDHFLSGFVLLSFNSRSSVFLKIPSFGENREKSDVGIHNREIFMFEHVLPHIFEPCTGQHYAPLCHAITETKGLVLEDLEARGYRTCDSKQQLDLEHCRVALTALAKYHALSVKFIRKSSRVFVDTLAQTPEYGPSLLDFGQDLYDRFLRLAKTLVSRSAHQKLREYKDEFAQMRALVSGSADGSSGFGVIAHGNLWTKNILFEYDDGGRVRHAKMINWQMSRIGSPVLDLVYFFLGSVPFEVFDVHRDALLDLYVDTLNGTLSALKCNCSYSRADLDSDLSTFKALFPISASCILQIVMTERDQQIFNLRPSNEISCGKYPSVVAKWLNYFVEKGIV